MEALDASGNVLSGTEASADLLNDYYALPEGSASLRISGQKAFAISELSVYNTQSAPEQLHVMTAQQSNPKVMLIAAHTGDEARQEEAVEGVRQEAHRPGPHEPRRDPGGHPHQGLKKVSVQT